MEYFAHNANSWCSRSVAGDAEFTLLDRCIGYSPVPVLPFGDQFLPTVKSEVGNEDEYEIWNLPNSADGDLIKYEIVPEAAIIPSELIHFEPEPEPVVVPPFACNPREEKSNPKGRSKEKKAKEQSVRKPRPRRAVAIKEKSQRNPKQRNDGRKAKEKSSTVSTSESVIFTRKKKMDETERQILERHLQWIVMEEEEEEEPEPLPKGRDENSNLEAFNTASPITCESNDTEYMIL